MSWETVIGLEVHAQLKTRSKMFCACSTGFGRPPNTNVCPVCLGHPGALPMPNGLAVRLAVRAAVALGCSVHETSAFARKHYFYPDLPKGYQISQFERPLATGGLLDVSAGDEPDVVRIARVHIEEDAGKLLHDHIPRMTVVDLNRCGIPLIEIVSEPGIRSPEHARRYLVVLKRILQYLEVSDCNMEEGGLRVDANLSVRRPGEPLGAKQEIKNMNSFAAVVRSLEQLRAQQQGMLERSERIALTTFSATSGTLRAMRTKEQSPDYRYAPEPDLPALVLSRAGIDVARERARLPELPAVKRRRLRDGYGLPDHDAGVLAGSRQLADFYEAVIRAGGDPVDAAKWVLGPVLADVKARRGVFRVAPARVATLTRLVRVATLSYQAAKKVFAAVAHRDDDPGNVAGHLGLLQVSDRERVSAWVAGALDAEPEAVARYRNGERNLLDFFIGQVMKRSEGRADPKLVAALIRDRLG